MAWEARSGLKQLYPTPDCNQAQRLNGLGSPFGIETARLRVQCNEHTKG